jgi:uncharacterized protein (DUF488 family)
MPQASRQGEPEPAIIFSLGHSTHPLEELLALLREHHIAALVDVRSFPGSRRWPQFNRAALAESIPAAGVQYHWLKELGGRRHGAPAGSPHVAWQLPAFRAYADYTASAEFAHGLQELTAIGRRSRTAFMCSEGLWWRCHRRIISDHLTILGWQVMHIMPDGKLVRHTLTPFARVEHDNIIYDRVLADSPGTRPA